MAMVAHALRSVLLAAAGLAVAQTQQPQALGALAASPAAAVAAAELPSQAARQVPAAQEAVALSS